MFAILLTAALLGDEPKIPDGLIRYGDTLYPVGTLERIRTFKSTDGKISAEGVLMKANGNGEVSIFRMKDKVVLNVPLKSLSTADRTWIAKLLAADKKAKRPPWMPE